MEKLSGKISDRIRNGEIDADLKFKGNSEEVPPKPESIRHGSGQGLGQGATRARSGE
jgi:hypothetical protein